MKSRTKLLDDLPRGGVIGVDPGRTSGAISYVWVEDGKVHGRAWPIGKMTERDIWNRISYLSGFARLAVLERVTAMRPKGRQVGVSSSFAFGRSYGELGMALIAAGIRFERVLPIKWQTVLSCRSKGDKRITKAKAEELFPDMRITHKTADSLLIAEYGRRLSLL